MKNKIKWVSALLIVVLISMLLCSCYQLDDMKAKHNFYVDDIKSELSFNGENYKKLNQGHKMWLDRDENVYEYVTEENVPVLLSSYLGELLTSYNGGDFIMVDGEVFCKSAEYDYYTELIRTAVLDKFCYSKGYFNSPQNYGNILKLVTDETEQAILEILENNNIYSYGAHYEGIDVIISFSSTNFDHTVLYRIYRCDKTALFYNEYVEVCSTGTNGEYFLKKYTSTGESCFYKIPDRYISLFVAIYQDISIDS